MSYKYNRLLISPFKSVDYGLAIPIQKGSTCTSLCQFSMLKFALLVIYLNVRMRQYQALISVNLLILIPYLVVKACASSCPATYVDSFIYSGRIIASLNDGMAPLNQDDDYFCYNYSLSYQVARPPEVAIAVHDFEVEANNRLYLYIKPLPSRSYSAIPFIIRTPWPYTKWNSITFSFLAEDRTDIQSGYYQIDSGLLSGCALPKTINTTLGFRTEFTRKYQIKYVLFLHGFEITTVRQQNQRSPFQLQIKYSSISIQGINIIILINSQTRVDSIYISYIAIQNPSFQYNSGQFQYVRGVQQDFSYILPTEIGRNYARLHGVSGFVLDFKNQTDQDFSFRTDWDGFGFRFSWGNVDKMVDSFTFDFIFFLGSDCQFCPGYPLNNQGQCVSACPINTFQSLQRICVNCGVGKRWNGTGCLKACPQTQYLNTITNNCQCPPTLNWNGQTCIVCSNGKIFDPVSRSCQCPKQLRWNGYSCAQIPRCTLGKIWDVYSYSCVCPEDKYWDGMQCAPIPTCQGGQILNFQFKCVCKEGYNWNGRNCSYSPCMGGQLWTGTACACPVGQNYNGSMCIECINGQKWNKAKMICECQNGYKWNSIVCEKNFICPGNLQWNQVYQQCICQAGNYWSGYKCIPIPKCQQAQYFDVIALKCVCPSGRKWDGTNCIGCTNGKVWNYTTLSCQCPLGSTQTDKGCSFQQKCEGGKVWVAATRSCQCPLMSVWNGNFCLFNPCNNGRIWSEQYKSCQCPINNIFVNGSCLPPRIACTNGRVWNPLIYACQCPPGTYQGTSICQQIPSCTNGKVYNPLTNKCNCPFGLVQIMFQCRNPECKPGQYFDGFRCQVINCPPPTYFYNNECTWGSSDQQCAFSQYWNGQRCVYYPQTCPTGTTWNNLTCTPSNSTCSPGNYRNNGECTPLPQLCIPPLVWNGKACSAGNSLCPTGTFWSINKCIPYTNCKNGYIWDAVYLRCVCPPGTFANSTSCVRCGSGKEWKNGFGCVCPDGYYDGGLSCEMVKESKCQMIANSFWINNRCVCRPGFIKVGFQCICTGMQLGQLCDRCSHKPNSQIIFDANICQCKKGYLQISGNCISSKVAKGEDLQSSCTVGTFFERSVNICLPCPPGCLSCIDAYRCVLCRPEFTYMVSTEKCVELCGDGKKFVVECDDGNNMDGDGCSLDCKIEPGYACTGGSPLSKDKCYLISPQSVTLQLVGQIRQQSSVTLNVQLSYVPQLLIFSSECSLSCNVLNSTILQGDKGATSISSSYVSGSQNLFTVTIEFGRPYIGSFDLSISINKIWAVKYFGKVSIGDPLRVSVNPSYLSIVGSADRIA